MQKRLNALKRQQIEAREQVVKDLVEKKSAMQALNLQNILSPKWTESRNNYQIQTQISTEN